MSYIPNYNNIISSDYSIKNKNNINFDFLNDNHFAQLLNERINHYGEQNNWLSLFGIEATKPIFENSGFNIQDLISSVNQVGSYIQKIDLNPINQITTSEMMTFMSSPFDSHNSENHSNNNIFNYIKRSAVNTYNKCASSAITNLTEFVKDAMKIS